MISWWELPPEEAVGLIAQRLRFRLRNAEAETWLEWTDNLLSYVLKLRGKAHREWVSRQEMKIINHRIIEERLAVLDDMAACLLAARERKQRRGN